MGNICVAFTCIFAATAAAPSADAAVEGSLSGKQAAGWIGLAITSALKLSGLMDRLVKGLSDVETNAVSLERILEYSDGKEVEAEWHSDPPPPADWPSRGEIAFLDYNMRYRPGLPLALKGMTLRIASGEKVGVVGRTGAGKSSVTLALFRLIEAASGRIEIDGIDVRRIGLHDLRSRISIIPQEPLLFSGSLRRNLDPLLQRSDQQLFDTLHACGLRDWLSCLSGGLDHEVSEGGSNLSLGERQLVCLARALLRRTRILVLDEATAAVDPQTDALMQRVIQSHCSNCTLITIAHRIHTILHSDRILVMDDGRVSELDSPQALMRRPDSLFRRLCLDAGIPIESDTVTAVAE